MENITYGNQLIVHGDCINEMANMTPESVDVVVTSPPYNIGIKYNIYKDRLGQKEYLDWIDRVAVYIDHILKPDGSFFLNVGSTPTNQDISYDIRGVVSGHFHLQNHIIWCKSISVANEDAEVVSYGHFKPINSKRFLNHLYEDIYHFTKTNNVPLNRLAIGVPYKDKSNIERWDHTEKAEKVDCRCRGNLWYIPYPTVMSKKEHPAGFPPMLPEMCIRLHGITKDTVVLDPFLGAGTTLLVCEGLGVHGIGIELDVEYVSLTKERLEEAYGRHGTED